MAGGNQDHLVGPVLCFTLRDQSYISKVPDPQKVFNRTEWISVLAEPNPIRFGKSSKMNSSGMGRVGTGWDGLGPVQAVPLVGAAGGQGGQGDPHLPQQLVPLHSWWCCQY